MKVSKNVHSLSDSSSCESDSSDNEDKSPPSPKKNFLIEIPHVANKANLEASGNISHVNPEKNTGQPPQGSHNKKRPPSPETMSKILGFEVKEAPRIRISKKKDNGPCNEPDPKRACIDKIKRADDLEQKFSWLADYYTLFLELSVQCKFYVRMIDREHFGEPNITSRLQNPYDMDDDGDFSSSQAGNKAKVIFEINLAG